MPRAATPKSEARPRAPAPTDRILSFVRDELAIKNIGRKKGPATPLPANAFFLSLQNLLGCSLHGDRAVNLAIPFGLAICTFLVTQSRIRAAPGPT